MLAGLAAVLLYGLVLVSDDFTALGYRPSHSASGIRGIERRLPGYDINSDQLLGAEVGFVVAVVLVLLFFVCLCGCCCRRGGGCSLWDLVACVCLYEMCCDDARVGDFQLI